MRFSFLLLLFCASAFSDIRNRGAFPFGEIESVIGNAGVGGAGSTGAVYYNPAALVELNHPKIAVSGSTYFHFKTDNEKLLRIDNTDLDYSAQSFNTVPSSVVSTFKSGDFTWAYFVLVPESSQIENRVTWTTTNTKSTLVQMVNGSELWLGAAAGVPITKEFALGAAFYAIRHTSLEHSSLVIDRLTATNTTTTTITHTTDSVYGLSLTLGAQLKPVNWMSLGLRIQSPLLHLSGTGDYYSGTRAVDNGTVTTTNTENDALPARYSYPLDMTVGARFNVSKGWDLHFDTSVQFGLEYSRFPGTNITAIESVKTTPRFNLGSRLALSPYWIYSAGAFFNPGTSNDVSDASNALSDADYLGFTTGIDFAYDRVKTGIGFFYAFSSNETPQFNNPSGTTRNKVRFLGVLVNIGYYL